LIDRFLFLRSSATFLALYNSLLSNHRWSSFFTHTFRFLNNNNIAAVNAIGDLPNLSSMYLFAILVNYLILSGTSTTTRLHTSLPRPSRRWQACKTCMLLGCRKLKSSVYFLSFARVFVCVLTLLFHDLS
jgi:hypothetical protein